MRIRTFSYVRAELVCLQLAVQHSMESRGFHVYLTPGCCHIFQRPFNLNEARFNAFGTRRAHNATTRSAWQAAFSAASVLRTSKSRNWLPRSAVHLFPDHLQLLVNMPPYQLCPWVATERVHLRRCLCVLNTAGSLVATTHPPPPF